MRLPLKSRVPAQAACQALRTGSSALAPSRLAISSGASATTSSSRKFSSTASSRAASAQYVFQPHGGARAELDSTTVDLLNDLQMGLPKSGRSKKHPSSAARASTLPSQAQADVLRDAETGNSVMNEMEFDAEFDEEYTSASREERRSPAAVFGAKRIGMIVLPKELQDAVQAKVDGFEDRKLLRQAYLQTVLDSQSTSLQSHLRPSSGEKSIRPARKQAVTPISALVSAVTQLPREYASVRNVLSELETRLGEQKWADLTGSTDGSAAKWVIWDGGAGSGVWAALDTLDLLPSNRSAATSPSQTKPNVSFEHVQASRHLSDLTKELFEDLNGENVHIESRRDYSKAENPKVALSTFQLSKIPTTAGRTDKIREMWESGADTLIIIDKGDKEGFRALAEARSLLLSLGKKTRADGSSISVAKPQRWFERPSSVGSETIAIGGETFYAEGAETETSPSSTSSEAIQSHVVAPRLQSPRFLRETKHSSRGEDGASYSYVVIRRGPRPTAVETESGRLGAVGKEEIARSFQRSTPGTIVPVVGALDGSHEVVHQARQAPPALPEEGDVSHNLRQEAYTWPRVVYSPLKRSGHVVMDACHPSSSIVRFTLPRSQSRQAYYDARKISRGDLFPHRIKGTPVVRARGFATGRDIKYRDVTHPDEASPEETKAMIEEHSRYLLNTYARPPLLFTRGKGCRLFATPPRSSPNFGKPGYEIEYLDLTAGIAVNALGHGDPEIARLLAEQMGVLSHSSNVCWNEWAGELAKLLVETTRKYGGLGLQKEGANAKVFFSNSGTEANEGALKFARLYGKSVGSAEKTALVCFNNAFHGRSMGALSVTPNAKYQDPFAPLIPDVRVGDLNDIAALDSLIDEKVCGVIVEPIQGEGGLNAPTDEFLAALAKRTRDMKAVLIYDEIQCGLFRTGNMWAHGHLPLDTQPDMVTMAKPLANGFPIGAIMVSEAVANVVSPGHHGTTFGGQVVATRLGHHVLSRLSHNGFVERIKETSEHLAHRIDRLPELFPELIASPIRGRGLIRGIPFKHAAHPGELVTLARQRGVLLLTAGSDAVRLIPSLTVTKDECDHAIDVVESCLALILEGQAQK